MEQDQKSALIDTMALEIINMLERNEDVTPAIAITTTLVVLAGMMRASDVSCSDAHAILAGALHFVHGGKPERH